METTIQQALTPHQEGKLIGTKWLYRKAYENQSTNLTGFRNLCILPTAHGRFSEVKTNCIKVIKFKLNYVNTTKNKSILIDTDMINTIETKYIY
tara:strand:- start:338 stop:619 length:282 start_codon:yes stop_codon:yes gene_type:complete